MATKKKRKKWTEAEEATLLREYSSLLSTSSSSSSSSAASASASASASACIALFLLGATREKRLRPLAERVNAAHHRNDPVSFPHLWSWRDVSVKLHNMRHQFLNVKRKLLNTCSSSSPLPLHRGLDLWPNFLLYMQVFGDIDPNTSTNPSNPSPPLLLLDDESDGAEDEEDDAPKGRIGMRREEEEKERERSRTRRRRRWEERREEEEMEWRERMTGMQMEHERQVMQMHADACQAQLQMIGVFARIVGQILGGGDIALAVGGMPQHVLQHQQDQQDQQQDQQQQQPPPPPPPLEEESPESLVGDNVQDPDHSGQHYL